MLAARAIWDWMGYRAICVKFQRRGMLKKNSSSQRYRRWWGKRMPYRGKLTRAGASPLKRPGRGQARGVNPRPYPATKERTKLYKVGAGLAPALVIVIWSTGGQDYNSAGRDDVMASVVLAYSGGLDTSVAIRWIKEHYDLDGIPLTIDFGNDRDLPAIAARAEQIGAIKAMVVDARADCVRYFVWPALQAGAIYE